MNATLDLAWLPIEVLWPEPPGRTARQTRTRNALVREGISSVGELTRCDEHALRQIRDVGVAAVAEIRRALHERGLHLRGEGTAL